MVLGHTSYKRGYRPRFLPTQVFLMAQTVVASAFTGMAITVVGLLLCSTWTISQEFLMQRQCSSDSKSGQIQTIHSDLGGLDKFSITNVGNSIGLWHHGCYTQTSTSCGYSNNAHSALESPVNYLQHQLAQKFKLD